MAFSLYRRPAHNRRFVMFALSLARRQIRMTRRQARPRVALRTRPAVEALEDRSLLSTGSSVVADTLYIGDGNDNTVKRFDASTGAYEGTFVTSGSGGLLGPRGLIFGERHNLLVLNQNVFTTGIGGELLRYDSQTGA